MNSLERNLAPDPLTCKPEISPFSQALPARLRPISHAEKKCPGPMLKIGDPGLLYAFRFISMRLARRCNPSGRKGH